MDENSQCLTFLDHEAAYRSRLSKNKKRFSARDLLNACIKLVDDYNCEALPDIAPDDHAKIFMPRLNVKHPQDQTFLTQASVWFHLQKWQVVPNLCISVS